MTFKLTAKQEEALEMMSGELLHILLYGGSRCVSGDTLLDGQTKTIAELAAIGLPVTVRTSHGWQMAEAPFQKGVAPLYEFLIGGKVVKVTEGHRFWDGYCWRAARSFSPGNVIAVRTSERNLPASIWERTLSAFRASGRRWKQTDQGSTDGCSTYRRRYGERLRRALTSALVCRASSFGALLRTRSFFPVAALESGSRTHYQQPPAGIGSRACLLPPRRSTWGDFPWIAGPTPPYSRESGCAAELPRSRSLGARLFQALFSPARKGPSPTDDGVFQSGLTPCDIPKEGGYELVAIDSITAVGEAPFYTLHVPGCEHYFANGVMHHNSAKTFALVYGVVTRAIRAPRSRHLILRYRFNSCKTKIGLDTFPAVMEKAFPKVTYKLNKEDWFATLPNGSEIWFGGTDDKLRSEKVLGGEYATIMFNECSEIPYSARNTVMTRLAQRVTDSSGSVLPLRAYYDENPPDKTHWTYRLFIQKIDPETKRPLMDSSRYGSLQMNPADNIDNVAPEYLSLLQSQSSRYQTRFLRGEFKDSSERSLFPDADLDKWRVVDGKLPDMQRLVIGVDPSGASEDNAEGHDAIGILVAGLGIDGNAYVLEDLTVKAGPATWGRISTEAYDRHQADLIVGESNFGGDMVSHVIQTARPRTPYRGVHSSRGKVIRAQPYSALVEQGRIRLAGYFPELEEELSGFTDAGYMGDGSPNRADALVFCLAALFPGIVEGPKKEEKPAPIPCFSMSESSMEADQRWMSG